MDKHIRSLYNSMVQEGMEGDEITRYTNDEIIKLLKEEEDLPSQQEYGTYRDKIFRAACIAEESGFVRGFKYAFHLFMECVR